MKLSHFRSVLARHFSEYTVDNAARVNTPLLNDADLAEIIQHVQAMDLAHLQHKDVHYRQAGDYRSAYLGSGLDFEEVRLYQRGDELRDMDWRTTARTGKPYLKVYREEHQPALHIVVDRGASMRFGTHKQLKVTLAARLAAVFAFAAMQSNTCIGGTLWQPGGFTLPCRNGETGATQLVNAAIAACPPLHRATESEARTFSEMLRELDAILPRGSRLILLSDFAALQEEDLPVLMQLATHHVFLALQVIDKAEVHLPNVGMMRFYDVAAGRQRWLDTGSVRVRNAYHTSAAALHQRQQRLFERVGVRLQVCTGDEDIYKVFARVNGYE